MLVKLSFDKKNGVDYNVRELLVLDNPIKTATHSLHTFDLQDMQIISDFITNRVLNNPDRTVIICCDSSTMSCPVITLNGM